MCARSQLVVVDNSSFFAEIRAKTAFRVNKVDIVEKPLYVRTLGLKAFNTTTERKSELLDRLSKQVSYLHRFVYGYTTVPEPKSAVRDDEIINWTFVDVCDDLNAACWNLASGFYKPAGTLLRCALDLGVAALYFQVQEDTNPRAGAYNEEFAKWDSGQADTPRWDTMINTFKKWPSVKRFDNQQGCSVADEIRDHFRYLCNFTHSRAYAKQDGSPTNNINTGISAPEFDEPCFERMRSLFESTVGWIATLWLITYPTILEARPLGDVRLSRSEYLALLSIGRAGDVLDFALAEVTTGP